ncbi:MAG: hypothetical protein KJ964_10415 [Verrucomicrobia bacterium]|nr:hypothetical protein [Verrucomicrobiota bacterium]MBU1856939.1 hypothetical protein [Verrucomicrobiota bacterium]
MKTAKAILNVENKEDTHIAEKTFLNQDFLLFFTKSHRKVRRFCLAPVANLAHE